MTKVIAQKFSVIYNLDGMSEVEIEAYKQAAAVYFDLDPDTNPFDVVWMNDDGSGIRRRQLYARRGTTDILREKRKISVLEMTQHDGPGYVSFTAKGKNAEGRQEVAVGAHSIAGLSGERLAAAVSTAETRAGRRLTLKFVGMGILDHTEVSDPVEVKSVAPALELAGSPAVMPPMPMFSPSAAPSAAVAALAPKADTVAQDLAEAAEISRQATEKLKTESASETPEQFHVRMEKMRADAIADVNAKRLAAQNPSIQGVSLQGKEPAGYGIADPPALAPATEAPKRTRRKKNTVDISAPGQVSAPVETAPKTEMILAPLPAGIPDTPENRARLAAWINEKPPAPPQVVFAAPTQVKDVVPTQANPAVAAVILQPLPQMDKSLPVLQSHQPILAPVQPAPVTDFPGKPSKEQEEKYRAIFREYSNQVLPVEGGMTPSPGIGGPSAKIRVFFEHYVGKSTQLATVEEWEEFITFLASFRERNGAKGLVKYINDSIGAK